MYIYSSNMKYSFVSKGTSSILVFSGFVPPPRKFFAMLYLEPDLLAPGITCFPVYAFPQHNCQAKWQKSKLSKEQVSVLVSAWVLFSKELKFFSFINKMWCNGLYWQFVSLLRQWCTEWYVELIVTGTHSKEIYSICVSCQTRKKSHWLQSPGMTYVFLLLFLGTFDHVHPLCPPLTPHPWQPTNLFSISMSLF